MKIKGVIFHLCYPCPTNQEVDLSDDEYEETTLVKSKLLRKKNIF